MLIAKQFRPENCASKDEARQHMCNVYLDAQKKRLVATNGHMLVAVPVTDIDPEDTSGMIQPEIFKQARKLTNKHEPATKIVANGCVKIGNDGAIVMPRVKTDATFPPYEQVIPTYDETDEDVVVFGVNVKYLLAVAEALGEAEKITLVVPKRRPLKGGQDAGQLAMLDPILVKGKDPDAIGVVMPIRV